MNEIGGTHAYSAAGKPQVGGGDGGVWFRNQEDKVEVKENDKQYIPGTGSYPTGIPGLNGDN